MVLPVEQRDKPPLYNLHVRHQPTSRSEEAIISHKYGFIFLKSRKTGGTSVSAALATLCGPTDTLALSEDVKEYLSIQRQNIRRQFLSLGPVGIRRYGLRAGRNLLRLLRGQSVEELAFLPVYRQHMDAREVREAVGNETWQRYFKFTIERNPYERLVSFYRWRMHLCNGKMNFEDFVMDALSGRRRVFSPASGFSNRPFYLDQSGAICVDRVLRYEHLDTEISNLFSDLGIEEKPNIPQLKRLDGLSRADYRSWYNERLLGLAETAFELEKRLFGYSF